MKDTDTKLMRLAEVLYEKYNLTIIDVDNFNQFAYDNKHIVSISKQTIGRYSSNIIDYMKNIDKSRKVPDSIDKVVIHYKSGKLVEFNANITGIKSTTPLNISMNQAIKEITNPVINSDITLGLFVYDKKNNSITIRRGKYQGCDVINKSDILTHFRSIKNFIGWCEYQISPKIVKGLKSPETERNIGTIKSLIKLYGNK